MSALPLAFLLLAVGPVEGMALPAGALPGAETSVPTDPTAPTQVVAAPATPVPPADGGEIPVPVPAPPPAPEALPGAVSSAPSSEVPVTQAAVEAPVASAPEDENADSEIVVSGRVPSPADPLASVNIKAYEAIQAVDSAVVGPVAKVYEKGVPGPLRSGLRNFLRNLEEPVSFVNYLLQLKPGRAVKSLGRFAVNSTVGVAGLFDMAKRKPFNLPYRPNGFANTLACYGVGNGPYFFVPLAGPITLRDLFGLLLDKAAVPMAVGEPLNRPYYAVPATVVDALSDRVEMDAQLQQLREESGDPYVATRELYLKQRRAEIGAICPKKGDATPDPDLPPRAGKGVN